MTDTTPTATVGMISIDCDDAAGMPDYRRPSWPDDGHKQFHLDLAADDIDATVVRCVELGATKPDQQPGGDRWTVLLDPAGHPFCVTNAANWG